MGDGSALQVSAAQAGLASVAQPDGAYGDLVVEGQFTFIGIGSMAQLWARNSAVGSYVAQLDTAGQVTLEKRDGAGAIMASWSAVAEPQAVPGSARTMQLSVMGGDLRVTVDGIDVLTAEDEAPLPAGANMIGALFAAPNAALEFDNYFVWVPEQEAGHQEPLAMALQTSDVGVLSAGNDLFANREIATGGQFVHYTNNSDGDVNEVSEPVPANGTGITKTVWYQFTPPASRQYLITSFGSSFDTILAVYTGTGSLATLVEVGSSDNVTGSLQARLTLALDSSQTYYIQLGGRNVSGGAEFRIMDPSGTLIPSTPTLSSTATGAPSTPLTNGARTNNLQPVLAWAPRPTTSPYGYSVELSTLANFSSSVTSPVITEPTRFWQIAPALNLPGQAAGQKYYWRVAAMNFQGQSSARSPAYNFTLDTATPLAPVLLSPALNGTVTQLLPTLKWKAVSDANRYRARIATNFSASTLFLGPGGVPAEAEVTSLAYTPAFNIPQGEYWYAVESRDAAGNWSGFTGEKRRFTVNVSLSPANGANIIAKAPAYQSNVLLTWTKVPGATYQIQVASDSSFSDGFTTSTITGTSHILTNLPCGTYYWRVHILGQSQLPQSLARRFYVTPALPVAPLIQTVGAQLGAVTSGGFTHDTTPVFDWTVPANWVALPPAQSITYELQLSKNSSFSPLVEFPVTGIWNSYFEWQGASLEEGTYYWRVRAFTNLGLYGAFSPAYRFTVDTTSPVAPLLTAPVVNGVFSTLRPTVKWKAVSDAVRYHVRIASESSVSTPATPGNDNDNVVGTAFTSPDNLPQGEYWFSVESRDAAGNWSGFTGEKRRFEINLSLTPAKGANMIAKAPLYQPNVALTWTKVPGATYTVEVDTDPAFGSPTVYGPFTTTSYTLTSLPVGIYYWRVAAPGNALPASLARSFTVTPALPVAPLIQTAGALPGAVTNKGTTSDVTPIFDWTVPTNWVSPPGGSSIAYELQLSTNSTFTQMVAAPVTSISNSTYEWLTSLAPGTYYWRVRAITDLGVTGAFSTAYRFTVQ